MAGLESRSLDSPDEVRTPERTTIDLVRLADADVSRVTFQPGWRWSDHVRPVAGTDRCQAAHLGVCLSGRIQVEHDDGSSIEIGPGDVYRIDPGHDAWVVGDEAYVGMEFRSAGEYGAG
jgi:quercetin dioxygenase-like cupin family protein